MRGGRVKHAGAGTTIHVRTWLYHKDNHHIHLHINAKGHIDLRCWLWNEACGLQWSSLGRAPPAAQRPTELKDKKTADKCMFEKCGNALREREECWIWSWGRALSREGSLLATVHRVMKMREKHSTLIYINTGTTGKLQVLGADLCVQLNKGNNGCASQKPSETWSLQCSFVNVKT